MGDAPDPPPRATERSKSGQPIYRHAEREREFEHAHGDPTLIRAVGEHVERHLGRTEWVLHEITSDLVHVDVHVVPPGPQREFYTLVTSGMSERPMTRPDDVEGCEFAELVACLPPEWPGLIGTDRGRPTSDPDHPWRNERNYWPIRWLKFLARFPHAQDTWLWYGHTIPNGDPPAPFAADTKLCCIMLAPNPLLPEAFHTLRVGDRDVAFWSLLPLYQGEMQYKLDRGAEALLDLFDRKRIYPIIDPHRPAAVQRRWWKFW